MGAWSSCRSMAVHQCSVAPHSNHWRQRFSHRAQVVMLFVFCARSDGCHELIQPPPSSQPVSVRVCVCACVCRARCSVCSARPSTDAVPVCWRQCTLCVLTLRSSERASERAVRGRCALAQRGGVCPVSACRVGHSHVMATLRRRVVCLVTDLRTKSTRL
jgi:hypothetical protein